MEISSNMPYLATPQKNEGVVKNLYMEKLTKDEFKELQQAIVDNANKFTFTSLSIQDDLVGGQDQFQKEYEEFQSFLADIGYEGKPLAQLSKEEASELVSDDGIFGIEQTAQRIADFVIKGAAGDEDMLRAGREGVLEGYNQAQKVWGGDLPDISQKTLEVALELIDKSMTQQGYSIIDEAV